MAKERSPFLTNVLEQGDSIADSWQPSAQLCRWLEEQGLNRYLIKGELRTQFILAHQQQDTRRGNWDALFKAFALQKLPAKTQPPAQRTAPATASTTSRSPGATASNNRHEAMSDDWRPSPTMVELILATICPNMDYLKAQLISFTSHFHGQYNPNWDQQFKKWINNGWNVYGHKNNFGKSNQRNDGKDQRSFVEKHTDKSWRDGL